MKKLTTKQNKYLRKLGHSLAPTVIVADRGLVDTVIAAIEEALDVHELIKVKVRQQRDQRVETYAEICKKTNHPTNYYRYKWKKNKDNKWLVFLM